MQCVHVSLHPFPSLQYVSAESHGVASFAVQSPPPPGYPAHPHPSNTFPPGGTIPNRTAVPTTGQQPMAGDKCKQYGHVYIRTLTHHSQFSRLGIQCPTLVYVMLIGSGLMGWVSFCSFCVFFPFWLVCYAHVFHVYLKFLILNYTTYFTIN